MISLPINFCYPRNMTDTIDHDLSVSFMKPPPFFAMLGLVLAFPFIGGCTWTPTVNTPIFSGSEGSIFLTTVQEETLRSNHPVTLDSSTLSTILKGIHIQQNSGILQQLITGEDQPTRVLSDAQVSFLTPHLLEAFAQVTAEEFVSFNLSSSNEPGENAVEGYLYKQGTLLIFTMGSSTNPNPHSSRSKGSTSRSTQTRLREPVLIFEPKEALHHNQTNTQETHGLQAKRLIINYEYMTTLSQSPLPNSSTSKSPMAKEPSTLHTPPPESTPLKKTPILSEHPNNMERQFPSESPAANSSQNNNSNLDDLRQQMQEMNRELEAQREEIKRLKGNSPTSSTP